MKHSIHNNDKEQGPRIDERDLVKKASTFLCERYKKNRHHVACVLQVRHPDSRYIYGLHLDSEGHDLCAEASAISNAIMRHETDFIALAAVAWDEKTESPRLIAPCGDCRQLLLRFAPNAQVILEGELGETQRVKASDLLPYPYRKLE